jgi:hypothetical protein
MGGMSCPIQHCWSWSCDFLWPRESTEELSLSLKHNRHPLPHSLCRDYWPAPWEEHILGCRSPPAECSIDQTPFILSLKYAYSRQPTYLWVSDKCLLF